MSKHPLAEVFGFPTDNMSKEANRYRQKRLCPYNNRVPNCTKDKAKDPLGVCSVFENNEAVITCPVRFRQDWIIADDAAAFFFPDDTQWTSLTEVRLNNKHGKSAGNIDVVLVAYDDQGKVTDFGALEVQAVYISGNVRRPFEQYVSNPKRGADMDWSAGVNYPRPDYLSSSRKRLAPQLIYKGGILDAWGKRIAVALNRTHFEMLPPLHEVEPTQASVAWLLYDLCGDGDEACRSLRLSRTVYTAYEHMVDEDMAQAPEERSFLWALEQEMEETAVVV